MFERMKKRFKFIVAYLMQPSFAKSHDEYQPVKSGMKRAYFIAWVVESAIGLLIFAVLFGTVAMPQFLSVSTSGWGTYAPLLWTLIPLACIAAYLVRIINSAKAGYIGPISGSAF